MNQYYLHDGQSQKGPFTLEELKSENIKPDTLIWYEGIDDWKKAGEIDMLQELFKVVPPPLIISSNSATKKSKILFYVIGSVVVVIISYLFYQNYKHQEEIKNVQTTLDQKNKEIEEQRQKTEQQEEQAANAKAKEDALAGENRFVRNEWRKYIRLSGSKYSANVFGGIKGLDLTVINSSKYPIDNMEVEVDYIKENGEVYKTETIAFKIIPAGTSKTLPAPESQRGTSVQVHIQRITATGFHFCYDRMYDLESGEKNITTSANGISGNPSDPWKCN